MLLSVGRGALWSDDGWLAPQLRRPLRLLCLLRHGAMRGQAEGEWSGASRRSLLGVAWVDDFTFYRWGGQTRGVPELRALAEEMAGAVGRYSDAGGPLWPPEASSAYASFPRGELGQEFFSLPWDASWFGWAVLLRWRAGSRAGRALRERPLVGTWPEGRT